MVYNLLIFNEYHIVDIRRNLCAFNLFINSTSTKQNEANNVLDCFFAEV